MIGKLRQAWTWFIEGLVEAILWGISRCARREPYRVEVGDEEAAVLGPNGARLGRLTGGLEPARFDPPGLARRLAGSPVDIVVPPAWLVRRDLDPVAVQSRPFLDAFVRHQIERITPWRVADTYYRVLQHPMPGDGNRLAVAVVVSPKRLAARWLLPLGDLHPRAVRLRAAGGPETAATAITLGGDGPRLAVPLRRAVVWGLAASCLVTVGLVGWFQWEAGLVRNDIDDQNRVLAERKAVVARAGRRNDPGGEAAAKLRALRESRPMAVAVIDALSAAVPDSAHLTSLSIDKDHVTIAGLSTDPSRLVPALENSGSFADVAFGAATTRVESGTGDRFSLEMKALVQGARRTAPPGAAASSAPYAAPTRP